MVIYFQKTKQTLLLMTVQAEMFELLLSMDTNKITLDSWLSFCQLKLNLDKNIFEQVVEEYINIGIVSLVGMNESF